jgi:hypothetical protein
VRSRLQDPPHGAAPAVGHDSGSGDYQRRSSGEHEARWQRPGSGGNNSASCLVLRAVGRTLRGKVLPHARSYVALSAAHRPPQHRTPHLVRWRCCTCARTNPAAFPSRASPDKAWPLPCFFLNRLRGVGSPPWELSADGVSEPHPRGCSPARPQLRRPAIPAVRPGALSAAARAADDWTANHSRKRHCLRHCLSPRNNRAGMQPSRSNLLGDSLFLSADSDQQPWAWHLLGTRPAQCRGISP